MVDRDMKEISDAIKRNTAETTRSMEKLVKIFDDMRREFAKIQHPSRSVVEVKPSGLIQNEAVPVSIDWESPTIPGTAKFYRVTDGDIIIIIDIDKYDAGRLDNLIESGWVKGLSLSAVDPV